MSVAAAAADQLARPIAAPLAIVGRSGHRLYLGFSLAVLVLAACLSVEGPQTVNVPLLNWPLPVLCHFRRITGLDCPGCGLTRGCIALMHGDVAAACRFNPATPLVVMFLAAQIPFRLWQLRRIARGQAEYYDPRLNWVLWVLVIGLLGQWVLRTAWPLAMQGTTS